ncbi:cutinase family protein [Nocardia sp. NPDC058499]|uniref:cutinase family protein n=1 Tax=Nocardia sp. NPDC058499 TaxID=3346530 RepID=UPI003646F15A
MAFRSSWILQSSRGFTRRSRGWFTQHRIAAAIAAPAALGVVAAVGATYSMTAPSQQVDTQLKASVTECHDMVTISVAGRGDTPREGTTKLLVDAHGNPLPAALSGDHSSEWVDPVVNAPADDVDAGSYAAVYIAYPADMATYEDAVTSGVANTQQVMREISQACPDTRFAIVGYSEGADVVRRVAMEIGHQEQQDGGYAIVDPDKVTGVVILADSGRAPGDGPFPGAENPHGNPDGFDQAYQNGKNPVPGQGALPDTGGDFGSLNGKIASFCSDGDLTCAAPENIALLQLVVNVARQMNVDALERDGLTPATGQDVAVVLSRVALLALADIQSQPNWMASDETFLEVLLRVSEPGYEPGAAPPAGEQPADSISTGEMAPLAYLPQKILNEIIGLIVTNQNTIPVILSDPYNLTLGPDATGHHFDYWRDADPANGKPLTSAEYAAAWLTHLAKQAQAGEPVNTKSTPTPEDLDDAYRAAAQTTTEKAAEPTGTTTAAPTATGTAPATTTPAAPTTTTPPPGETTTVPPSSITEPPSSTTAPPNSSTVPANSAPATEVAAPPTTTPTTTTPRASEPTTETPATQSGESVAQTTR